MTAFVVWPRHLLAPRDVSFNQRSFSRSGGVSLGGIERVTRTDRGYWVAQLTAIPVGTTAQRRSWNAIRTGLGGRAGLVVVPAYESATAPSASVSPAAVLTPYSDGTAFDDDSEFSQRSISVEMGANAAIGATSVVLRLIDGEADLVGVRFSYRHALYETGTCTQLAGDMWTVSVFPAIRAAISEGEALEFDEPDCLMRLAADNGMDIDFPRSVVSRPSVDFIEAADYWNDLAA